MAPGLTALRRCMVGRLSMAVLPFLVVALCMVVRLFTVVRQFRAVPPFMGVRLFMAVRPWSVAVLRRCTVAVLRP
ncbi:hypothetical protein GCM10010435_65450 [Winogradskya consettensis]|uniref:Uncharacterized protein n=1 Tax=Winogradskya consettensis TaxID=113560 RepID=A0A919T4K8_9ACTN|nr:hypothetical protein [Actinoplanes consettensis]GIM84884.1 hypothetical protein Aco04nite_93640 [Actinoplanes consettensis]